MYSGHLHHGLSATCSWLSVRSSSGQSLHCTWSLVPAPALGCSGPCDLVLSSSPDWLAAHSFSLIHCAPSIPSTPSTPSSWFLASLSLPQGFPSSAHSSLSPVTGSCSLPRSQRKHHFLREPNPTPSPSHSPRLEQTPCCMIPEPLALTCTPQARLQ